MNSFLLNTKEGLDFYRESEQANADMIEGMPEPEIIESMYLAITKVILLPPALIYTRQVFKFRFKSVCLSLPTYKKAHIVNILNLVNL